MRGSSFARLAAVVLFLLGGCGGGTLRTRSSSRTLVLAGEERRAVLLTDVDDVRSVGVSNDAVLVATDRGVLVYPSSGDAAPTRLTIADGLPGNDVTALAVAADGLAIASTDHGLAAIVGRTARAFAPAPPLGRVNDLLIREDRTMWACGVGGLARFQNGGWERVGEDAVCTRLVPGDGDKLWIGTTQGLWLFEGGDVIREHGVRRGIPEGYVRDIAPYGEHGVFALLAGPDRTILGHFDGQRWFGYSIPEFPPPIVALGRASGDVAFYTQANAFVIGAPRRGESGASLVPMSAGRTVGVSSYRARITPAARAIAREETAIDRPRAITPLAEVPARVPSIDAPRFEVFDASVAEYPREVVRAWTHGGRRYFADRNRGVLEVREDGTRRWLRTNDMLITRDLAVATDTGGRSWLVDVRKELVMYNDGALRRAPVPEGWIPECVGSGPDGAYFLARSAAGSTVKVFRSESGRWTEVLSREVRVPDLAGFPFMGVAADGTVWAAVAVRYAQSEIGWRTRGAIAFARTGDATTYHHQGATPATDGPGATSLSDEIYSLDFVESNAWFSSLSGAIRVGGGQAVVFGEERGVRGEIVSDLAAAPGGRLWISAAEGIAMYDGTRFDFAVPELVRAMRPTQLAVDSAGMLWGSGPRGAIYGSGTTWTAIDESGGLIATNDIRDIDVDARGRVFMLVPNGVLVLSRQP